MDDLAASFLDALARGEPLEAFLRHAGEAEPARAATAFAAAAAAPRLAAAVRSWAPPLLVSARPGFGAECLLELAHRHDAVCGAPIELAHVSAVAAVLGGSNFLARLLLRHPMLLAVVGSDPDTAVSASPPAPDWAAIRASKYRGLLAIVSRDLAGRPLGDSLRELSDLADRCLGAALVAAADETGSDAPSLLALGKLGGRELNFSSDVDLLFVYDAADEAEEPSRHDGMSRVVRALKRGLEEPNEDGFAYRVDLDLRPEGPQGPLANSVDAALSYYESFGQEWERQMLIRLRRVAGPSGPAEALQHALTPFVFRRLIDPGVARAVRAMKTRIEEERRRAGRDLEVELKEGPGGIRDVEFLVQAFQLFHGGRDTALRHGTILELLGRLGERRLLPEAAVAELQDAYTWLRRAEHALQLAEDRQTQRFPREAVAQTALARRMGYREPEGARARDRLLDDWTTVRATVRQQFDALVLGGDDE
jgi:glutamate-ammonia-ligase adenylyltransferase